MNRRHSLAADSSLLVVNVLVVLCLLWTPVVPAVPSAAAAPLAEAGSGALDSLYVAGPLAPGGDAWPLSAPLTQTVPVAVTLPVTEPISTTTAVPTSVLTPTMAPTLAPTATVVPPTVTDVPTETPTVAPVVTPTMEPTATPDVTATVTPTPTTPAEYRLSLSKVAWPTAVQAGEVVTFCLTVANEGEQAVKELAVEDPLPPELVYVAGSAEGARYDAESRTVRWAVPAVGGGEAISLSLAARVEPQVEAEAVKIVNVATLTGAALSEPLTATAVVEVLGAEPGWTTITPDRGGVMASADGQVVVEFPVGAVRERVEASHKALEPVEINGDRRVFYRFELNARPVERPEERVHDFAAPVTVTLTYSDTEIEGLVEETLHIVSWDEATGLWEHVPTRVNARANRLTAQVSHFSIYGGEGEDETYFVPRIEAGQVSLFSGDSSFSYDLAVPAGAGGMQVPLTLRYHGGIPNTLRKPLIGPDTGGDTSWVGVGWTLEVGRIEDGSLTLNGLSGQWQRMDDPIAPDVPATEWDWDGQDKGFGGVGTWVHRRHRLENEEFVRIESHLFNSANGKLKNKGYYEVWTKDGTRYIFGSHDFVPTNLLYPSLGGTGSRLSITNNNNERDYKSWLLDTIIDPEGNKIEIEWAVYPKILVDKFHLKEAYPKEMRYTTNSGAGDGHAEYRIEFVTVAKDYDTKWNSEVHKRFAATGRLLTQIREYYRPLGGGEQLVRKYVLSYGDSDSPQYYVLNSITEYGSDTYTTLPVTTLGYTMGTIGWKTDNGWSYTVDRPFLNSVNNGYGGVLTFGYEDYCLPATQDCTQGIGWGQRQRVEEKTVDPGAGGTVMSTDYGYGEPAYVENLDKPFNPLKEFIGFSWATEDAGTVRHTRTEFYDTIYEGNGHPKDPLKGKVLASRTGRKVGSTWAEYTEINYSYVVTNYQYTDPEWPRWANFAYLSQETEERCSNGACQSKKTTYHYDTHWQSRGVGVEERQYGNVTRVKEYASAGATTPYRTTLMIYCPNASDWIVDKAAVVNVYAGDVGEPPSLPDVANVTWSRQSIYGSDPGNGAWNQVVNSQGRLQGVRRFLGKNQNQQSVLVDTRYGYDAWGNVTTETAYNSYGLSNNWATENPVTTTTAYDGQGIWPVSITQPEVDGESLVEEREYYEVNETDGQGTGLPGQLKRVRDARNGDDTWYYYDVFGRLVKEIGPYDSGDYPTVEYWYHPPDPANGVLYPKRTEQIRERSAVGGAVQVNFTFYDGLGRVIETLTERTDGGQQILAYRTYDELGRVKDEYVPYVVSSDFWNFKALDTGQAKTSYSYDALGRPTQVVGTDGVTSTTTYVGGTTISVDGNGHRRDQTYDPFGRLVQVDEYAGGGSPYVTTYTYDESDNLLAVTDALGNVTEMTYDLLGRKVAMDDPDMGVWSYGYDALGNLTTQTDALGQVITFTYDALNRVTEKDYSTSDPSVYYRYDDEQGGGAAANSWGRLRASYVGSKTDNGHQYGYDDRGRMISETVWIDGSAYTTLYEYDAMNRVTEMTYPDNETVSTEYNPQTLPITVTGDSTYVSQVAYDELGRPEFYTIDDGARQVAYEYYDWDTANGAGRLWKMQAGTSGSPASLQNLTYAYDAVGNVSSIVDGTVVGGAQTQSFGYDALDRLTSASATGGSAGQGQYSETYTYNAIGNMMSKGGVTYTYPASGPASVRPHAVTSTSSGDSFSYDANGNMTTRVENGVTYQQTWDAENRLATVTANGETTSFTYDADGVLVKRVDATGTTVMVGEHYEVETSGTSVQEYAKDFGTSQGWSYPEPGVQPSGGTAVYASINSGGSAYAMNSGGHFTVPAGATVRIRMTRSFASGDMSIRMYETACSSWSTCRGQTAYIFGVPAGSGTAEVVRTDLGGKTIRTLRLYRNHNGGSTAQASYLEIYVETGSGSPSTTSYYFFAGQRVAMDRDGVVQYLLSDHLHSTSLVINDDGSVAGQARYYPYGEERWSSGTLSTDFKFTGQRKIDSAGGIYHMGARFYDGSLGRWTSPDTLVPDPANPQSFNRYSWVLGNPLRYVDPDGHFYFDYEEGILVWNGVPWLEASQNVPEGFDLMEYPDPDPGIQVRPNLDDDGTLASDGSYIVSSPDNPTFVYPTEVKGTAKVLRAELGGEQAVPVDEREDAASSVVWVMRNMVEKGRPWRSGRGKTEYPAYSSTWSQFAGAPKGLREDEVVALRVFLGQIADEHTGGGVYMINDQCWKTKPDHIKNMETGQFLWGIGPNWYGHHFYCSLPGFCP